MKRIYALLFSVLLIFSSSCASATEPNSLKEFKFAAIKDITKTKETYPVIGEIIDSTFKDDALAGVSHPSVFEIAAINDIESKGEFLFLRISGSLTCGTAGCASSLFKTDHKTYKKLLDINTHSTGRIYLAHCPHDLKDVSLILNGGHGANVAWGLWKLKMQKFEYLQSYPSLSQVPLCMVSSSKPLSRE